MSEGRPYIYGPPSRPSVVAGLGPVQVGGVAVAGLVGLGIIVAQPNAGGALGLLAVLAAGAALALVRVEGRSLDAWVRPAAVWLAGTGRRRWVSPLAGEDVSSARRGTSPEPPALKHVVRLAVATTGGEVGVLKDTRTGTYCGVVAVRGRAFALVDGSEKERRLSAWGDVCSSWAREETTLFRLQWIERTLPEDGDAIVAHFEQRRALAVGAASALSYAELVADAAPASQRHETYLVLAVSSRTASSAIRTAGGGERGTCEVLVAELRSLARRMASAEVSVGDILSLEQLDALLASCFDPFVAIRTPSAGPASTPREQGPYPLATDTGWSCYRAGDAWHATFWVGEWPRDAVPGDFLAPLILEAQGTRTISVVAAPVRPSRARREVEMAQTSFEADEEIRARHGYRRSARRHQEFLALERREEELATGHGEYRYSAYLTVSAPSREELDASVMGMRDAACQARLELVRLSGQQEIAFTAALPLARHLR